MHRTVSKPNQTNPAQTRRFDNKRNQQVSSCSAATSNNGSQRDHPIRFLRHVSHLGERRRESSLSLVALQSYITVQSVWVVWEWSWNQLNSKCVRAMMDDTSGSALHGKADPRHGESSAQEAAAGGGEWLRGLSAALHCSGETKERWQKQSRAGEWLCMLWAAVGRSSSTVRLAAGAYPFQERRSCSNIRVSQLPSRGKWYGIRGGRCCNRGS